MTGLIALALQGSSRAAAQEAAPDSLVHPTAVAAGPDGTLYIADRNLPGVWKVQEGELSVFFQASRQFRTPLNAVMCLAVDGDGRLLAGDSATREVYRFDESGTPQPLTGGQVEIPSGLAVMPGGEILVSDLQLHRIWRIPAEGGEPELYASVAAPLGLHLDPDGVLWVVSRGRQPLHQVAADGSVTSVVEGRPFQFPHNVVVDAGGTAYVSDSYASTIWRLAAGEEPTAHAAGSPLQHPVGLALRDDRLIVVDARAQQAFTVSSDGTVEPLTGAGD